MLYYKLDQHTSFLWFKRGISLKFSKWFIKWLYDFGSITKLMPKPPINLSKKNSNFILGYIHVSFVASQVLIGLYLGIILLSRSFKI